MISIFSLTRISKHQEQKTRTHYNSNWPFRTQGKHSFFTPASSFNPEPVLIILLITDFQNSTQQSLLQALCFPVEIHSIVFTHSQGDKWAKQNQHGLKVNVYLLDTLRLYFKLQGLPDCIMQWNTDTCSVSDMGTNPFHYIFENQMMYMCHFTIVVPSTLVKVLMYFIVQNPVGP